MDLWTFDDADSSTFGWKLVNDPVMGGLSNSTFSVDADSATAAWVGEVRVVPSLDAPGFCNAETTGWPATFNDASAYDYLQIKLRASIDYVGYKISFAADTMNPQFASYKAPFNVTADGQWQVISIPWNNFSNDWSAYTGDCFTQDPGGKQHVCCTPETPDVCPTTGNLKDISQIGLWMEGGAGKFDTEIAWIRAGNDASVDTMRIKPVTHKQAQPATVGDFSCSNTVQNDLRYNVSDRYDSTGLPVEFASGEDLVTAICCDTAFAAFAEPNGFYSRPDVNLLATVKQGTKFFDSVCGEAIFQITDLDRFTEETNEHGWPSFRDADLLGNDVKITDSGDVYACGTKLGSNLPDSEGNRYCLDLTCISGNGK